MSYTDKLEAFSLIKNGSNNKKNGEKFNNYIFVKKLKHFLTKI